MSAILRISPVSKSFGLVINDSTNNQTFTVTNDGTDALTVSGITGISAPFSVQSDNVTGNAISGADSSTFVLRYIPHVAGVNTATMSLASNDSSSPKTVSIDGTSEAAFITVLLTPSSYDFGPKELNSTSTVTITVTNSGDVPLIMGTLTGLAAPFSIVSDNVSGQTIAPAGSATVGIKFIPTANGDVYDQLLLPSNDDESPAVFGVKGMGDTVARERLGTGHRSYSGKRFEMWDMQN